MKFNQHFEVYLNFISSHEHQSQPEEVYKREYEPLVSLMLISEDIFLFEEDLISKFGNRPISEILDENLGYVPGIHQPNPKKDGKFYRAYYDTWMPLSIEPRNPYYDHFLGYLLKHIDLLKIDQCLDYQLEKYHNNNITTFSRLLVLMLRKFSGSLIPEKTVVTVQEWIAIKTEQQKSDQENISNSDYARKKNGKINRRAEDNITSLNREQTILLIQYLKEAGVFLKDEYLTDADAGKAFELLTGFSQNTLRQDLGKFYQFQSKDNLHKLHQLFSQLIQQIDKQSK
ncbi:MAG: hypothetical protein ABI663_20305 [Chryseolinea sp.]